MAAGGTGGEGALGPGGAGGTEPGRCVGHLWGLWAPALLQDSSGRRPGSLGRAEPWARWHLPAPGGERLWRSLVLSCPAPGRLPAEGSGTFLGGSSGGK